jgi:hypothetical protein
MNASRRGLPGILAFLVAATACGGGGGPSSLDAGPDARDAITPDIVFTDLHGGDDTRDTGHPDIPRDIAPDPVADAVPELPGDAPDAVDVEAGDAAPPLTCDVLAAVPEECNGLDDDCDGRTDEDMVLGTCARQWGSTMCIGPRTCVDAKPACQAGPPTDEVCNGWDDDCDGQTDEPGTPGCVDVWLDQDQDGWGTGASRCDCGFLAPWTARQGGDCDDSRADVHPEAPELCDDRDNDCDDQVDPAGLPDCVISYADLDQDGSGDPASVACLCPQDQAGRVADGTDCNDGNAAVHPGAVESCNDGLDDDCDGAADDGPDRPGCVAYHVDGDLDGWGDPAEGPCLCHADGQWATARGGDCDDGDATRNPGMAESCNDLDDDCDGATDEDFDCDPGTEALEACGFCGTRHRTCGGDCLWPGWSECEGTKTCAPGTLQPCVEGCGNRACTDGCEWPEACGWTLDAYEPDDARATPRYLGYYEEPDAPATLSAWIHSAGDVDWYSFTADEEFPIFVDTDGSLVGSATLTTGPGTWELCILWDEGPDGNVDDTRCTTGNGYLYVETPDVDPGLFDEAYGTIFVSVRGDTPSCSSYSLSFDWD